MKVFLRAYWWLRFAVKVSLLSSGLPYSFFYKIGLFRHGAMDEKEYVDRLWKLHFNSNIEVCGVINTKTFLELGPGDSLNSAFKAKSEGFERSIFVDTGAYASDSEAILKKFSVSEQNYTCEYLTEGKRSLESLPDSHVSFVFSNSVLQHIDLDEVDSTLDELYRTSDEGCIQSHVIDLRDMICRSAYHHDCPDFLWEADFFKKFPIYTNRLGYLQWINCFIRVGFELVDVKIFNDQAVSLDVSQIIGSDLEQAVANLHLIVRKNR